ncbi:MAG: flagellar motor switch protein FliG [Marinosulfonomonas sp.]|nr:flagellar motor switch protein FliG [Marinosulfonomonas sp.]
MAPPPPQPTLSGRQKAAIVVRLILAGGTRLSLQQLPDHLQTSLIEQMATINHIDHHTVNQVIADFVGSIETTGLNFPGALEGTLDLLEGTISNETAARIRAQAGLARFADPWERIGGMETDVLLEILNRESIEVAAVLLSKLKVSKAAELLGLTPGERARRITYAISLTGDISPAVVDRIGQSIAQQLDVQPERAFSEGPVERVGAILNFSPSMTREDVLDGLEQTDSGFATQVRRAIFTFANIPARIDPRDVPKIVRDVDPEQLNKALAGATGADAEATEFILSNMSQRMAGQLREDMEALGEVAEKDAEAAMTAVVITIRELEANGDIYIVAEDD